MQSKQIIKSLMAASLVLGSMLSTGTVFADNNQGVSATVTSGIAVSPSVGWQRGAMRDGDMMGKRGVMGTITAISGNTLTLKSAAFTGRMMNTPEVSSATPAATTVYTVDVARAIFLKSGTASALSGLSVGDTVMVNGTITGTTIAATSVHGGMMVRGRGDGNGTGKKGDGANTTNGMVGFVNGNGQPVTGGSVTAINGSNITLTNTGNVTYTVNAANAAITKAGASSSVSAIAVGDRLIVQGAVNGQLVTATSILDQGITVTHASTTSSGDTTSTVKGGLFKGIGGFFQHLFGFF